MGYAASAIEIRQAPAPVESQHITDNLLPTGKVYPDGLAIGAVEAGKLIAVMVGKLPTVRVDLVAGKNKILADG